MGAALVLPSGSAVDRAITCIDSEFITPRRITAPNPYSDHGNTVHTFIRAIGSGTPRDEALAEISEDDPARQACEDFDVENIPAGGHFELALAWDFAAGKGRVLGENLGRAYEAAGADRSKEYVLSIDFGGVRQDRVGIIVDWKTGWTVKRAKDSWQLKLGAVAVADMHGLEEVVVAHLYLRNGTEPRWDIYEIDALELAAIRKALRALAQQLTDRRPTGVLVEGEHCRYCPAFKACPAKTSHMRALAVMMQDDPPNLTGLPAVVEGREIDGARARAAVLLLERYDAAAKQAWKELEEYARMHPIDLGDGRVMKEAPGDERDKVIQAKQALATLAENCDQVASDKATTTTKKLLEEAAADFARRTKSKIGATKEAVLKAIRQTGALHKEPGKIDVRIIDI